MSPGSDGDVTSTLPDAAHPDRVKRARDLRRVGLVALFAFLLAGGVGLLGTRTGETTAASEDWSIVVTHPKVSRPGHAVRLEFEVKHRGGFGTEPVRLRFLSRYFDLFDENAFTPVPDSETADDRYTFDEFAPPDGDVLLVSVDTRIEPARQRGEAGEVAVLDEQGRVLVVASFRTRLLP